MRKLLHFSALLSLFLLVPASIIWAQKISSEKGLTTATFNTPIGVVKVYLPDDIRQGDIISGTVVSEPSGNNARQKEKNLAELKKYSINFNDEKFPVGNKTYNSIQFSIQTGKPVNGRMELISSVQTLHGEVVDVKVSNNIQIIPHDVCEIPSHALTGSPLNIPGPFDGNSSNTVCSIGSLPVTVLAESPRGCVIKFPENAKEVNFLSIQENRKQLCSQIISAVNMKISAGKLNLLKGEMTFIDIKITGLENLPDTATLTLTNITTETIALFPSNFFKISLIPDSVSSGSYERRFNIQSLKTGLFNVNVDLDLNVINKEPGVWFDLHELKNESGYPGSYGYRGDIPCIPEGSTTKWRWHKTFKCEIIDRKILRCGFTKEGDEVYDKIKELLEKAELDKATDIAEKMAKAFSTAKAFSYSIHVIRKWVDYDIEYKCINGKWQPIGGVYVKADHDDLGWQSVKNLLTECWITFDSPAAEKELMEALEIALMRACK